MIEGADNRVGAKEDSPARLIFAFDGDKSNSRSSSGRFLHHGEALRPAAPYALLQYIWAADIPVGRSSSIRIRAASGCWWWQAGRRRRPLALVSRNLHDDFRKAFHEEPGLLTGVGVLTDTDNTGGSVEAWYGDIRVRAGGALTRRLLWANANSS